MRHGPHDKRRGGKKWGVSVRAVSYHLTAGRIPGAHKKGKLWLIPADAKRPADQRRRGNEAAPARLRICLAGIAAAVSKGDYAAYTEMQDFLTGCIRAEGGGRAAAFAELSLATAALSCIVPNMTPEWLRRGHFSAVYPPFGPFALYLQAKYHPCTGRPALMLAVAQTALALCAEEEGFALTDIYLQLSCAVACHALEQEAEARTYLLSAMKTAPCPTGLPRRPMAGPRFRQALSRGLPTLGRR